MKQTCKTCSYAVITLVAECTKKSGAGEYLHQGGFCPEEMTCPYWEQADPITLEQNSIDWGNAPVIFVD